MASRQRVLVHPWHSEKVQGLRYDTHLGREAPSWKQSEHTEQNKENRIIIIIIIVVIRACRGGRCPVPQGALSFVFILINI